VDPSWGPVGSLLQRKDPALYAHLLEQHESMVALERARKAGAAQAALPDGNRTADCPQCGVTFTPQRANQRFCSEKCRKTAFNQRHSAA
jgi:protein-arginine kinase activator protein McsA